MNRGSEWIFQNSGTNYFLKMRQPVPKALGARSARQRDWHRALCTSGSLFQLRHFSLTIGAERVIGFVPRPAGRALARQAKVENRSINPVDHHARNLPASHAILFIAEQFSCQQRLGS
jgi:hypothetical protein